MRAHDWAVTRELTEPDMTDRRYELEVLTCRRCGVRDLREEKQSYKLLAVGIEDVAMSRPDPDCDLVLVRQVMRS